MGRRVGAPADPFSIKSAEFLNEGDANEPPRETQSVERRIINLLKGYTIREREAVYKTIKYILRQKRKLGK